MALRSGRACRHLHFLHAANFDGRLGTPVGQYVVHYADQRPPENVPIVYGEDLLNWWTQDNEPIKPKAARLAWLGTSPASDASTTGVRLFKMTWNNPFPDAEVLSIDFISCMNDPAPFLVALTAD